MDALALDIPLYRQEPGTRYCGLYCLKMVYAYYGLQEEVRELMSEVQLIPTGVYVQELGHHLLRHGFRARLITKDTTRFPVIYGRLPPAEVLRGLRERLRAIPEGEKEHIFFAGLLNFLEAGGELSLRIPTLEDIGQALARGHPSICSLDAKALYQWDGAEDPEEAYRPGQGGHYVVVSGFTPDGAVRLNDSSSRHGGIKFYPKERFLYALYSFQGWVLRVEGRR